MGKKSKKIGVKGTVYGIWTEYIVLYALCTNQDVAHEFNIANAHKALRKWGWSKTSKHSWICSSCNPRLVSPRGCER